VLPRFVFLNLRDLIEDSPQRHREHRGGRFFPGRETTAREKSLRFRRKLFSLSPTVDMKQPVYQILPEGLRSLARSPSPDRARKILSVLSVSPWLVNKSGYRNLVSTVCGGFVGTTRENSSGKQNEVKPRYVTSKNEKAKIAPIFHAVL